MTGLPSWFPDWHGETIVIVASGPSAATAGVEQAKGLAKVIAVNSSWRLAPWADVLFACDYRWWEQAGGCPEFLGLKVTMTGRAAAAGWGVQLVECIHNWGRNSGAHCLYLATQAKPRRIILVGYDMTLNGGVHWHGPHGQGLNNPRVSSISTWRKQLDRAAAGIARQGIEVINASPVSALTAYPKMTLAEALETS